MTLVRSAPEHPWYPNWVNEKIDAGEHRQTGPREFIGSDQPTFGIALGMEPIISDLKMDHAKAVWSILAFTWAIKLEKHEVLHLPFWDYEWLLEFIAHAKATE